MRVPACRRFATQVRTDGIEMSCTIWFLLDIPMQLSVFYCCFVKYSMYGENPNNKARLQKTMSALPAATYAEYQIQRISLGIQLFIQGRPYISYFCGERSRTGFLHTFNQVRVDPLPLFPKGIQLGKPQKAFGKRLNWIIIKIYINLQIMFKISIASIDASEKLNRCNR